ncbi:hypothetical protein RRG08_034307 [Elysia crispata]|uniref:Uncharacterized protein n=1 Tax=Elysia crispata TaxID=231223 RepID=A0AAE1DYG5_9GAST|nr:hypothetical protein RRG08_034307 [Elysia crispata]
MAHTRLPSLLPISELQASLKSQFQSIFKKYEISRARLRPKSAPSSPYNLNVSDQFDFSGVPFGSPSHLTHSERTSSAFDDHIISNDST